MKPQFKTIREKFAKSGAFELSDTMPSDDARGLDAYPSADSISVGDALAATAGPAALLAGAVAGGTGLSALLSHLKGVTYKKVGRHFGKSPESQKKLYNLGLMGLIPGYIYNRGVRDPDTILEKLRDSTTDAKEYYREGKGPRRVGAAIEKLKDLIKRK